jgi:hypothetical protein
MGFSRIGFSLSGLNFAHAKCSLAIQAAEKKALFCDSERREESLFDLGLGKETKRDSSLRSE